METIGEILQQIDINDVLEIKIEPIIPRNTHHKAVIPFYCSICGRPHVEWQEMEKDLTYYRCDVCDLWYGIQRFGSE